MTEEQWVDADEALEDAAVKEGAAPGNAPPAAALDPHLDDESAGELLEDAHQAGD